MVKAKHKTKMMKKGDERSNRVQKEGEIKSMLMMLMMLMTMMLTMTSKRKKRERERKRDHGGDQKLRVEEKDRVKDIDG